VLDSLPPKAMYCVVGQKFIDGVRDGHSAVGVIVWKGSGLEVDSAMSDNCGLQVPAGSRVAGGEGTLAHLNVSILCANHPQT